MILCFSDMRPSREVLKAVIFFIIGLFPLFFIVVFEGAHLDQGRSIKVVEASGRDVTSHAVLEDVGLALAIDFMERGVATDEVALLDEFKAISMEVE